MKIIFLSIFILSSVIHLYASYVKNVKLRACTKGFILAGLLGWYCVMASPAKWIVIAAIFFSWLGDVLLIPNGVKWFTAGGIAFIVSHFCFALAYADNVIWSRIPVWAIILIAAAYAVTVFIIFRGLKEHLSKKLFYPMFLYLLINGLMNCFAFFQLLSVPCLASALVFVGAVCFFISDSILFFVRFNKNTRWKSHFPVMLAYIVAEFLIVWGLILLG